MASNLTVVVKLSIILRACNVSKSFNTFKGNRIINNISFSIKKGTISVIKGKSGTGKSTFLSILSGMLKPDSGNVYFKNTSLYDLTDEEQAKIRGESFGFVFQSFQLIPELTVKENIELPLQFTQKKRNIDNKLIELTKYLGIYSHLNKKPSFLSGGEQQRVAIARSLIMSPEIIFADEPTGSLDEITSKTTIDLLTQLSIEQGVSLVVVTHEERLINHPHNLYIMKDGELILKDENA